MTFLIEAYQRLENEHKKVIAQRDKMAELLRQVQDCVIERDNKLFTVIRLPRGLENEIIEVIE
jgi:hypothetical protein